MKLLFFINIKKTAIKNSKKRRAKTKKNGSWGRFRQKTKAGAFQTKKKKI